MFRYAVILAVSIGILLVLIKLNSFFELSTDIRCFNCSAMRVTRIIDGDTFVTGVTRVRLYGIDAREVGERCADEATERLRKLAGETVRIERGPREADVYGRSLAYVYTDAGLSIDELLVKEGLAVAWTSDGQHRDHLMEQERRAKEGGVGCLW